MTDELDDVEGVVKEDAKEPLNVTWDSKEIFPRTARYPVRYLYERLKDK